MSISSRGKETNRIAGIEKALNSKTYNEEDFGMNSKFLLDKKIKFFEKQGTHEGKDKVSYDKAKEVLAKLEAEFPGKSTTVKKTVTVKANRPNSAAAAAAPKAAPKSAVDKAAAAAKAAQDKAAKAAAAAAEAMKKAEEAAKKAQTVAENAAKPKAAKAAKASTRKANNKNTVPNIYTNMSKITHSPSGRAYGPENSLKSIAHNLERAYVLAQSQYRKSRKNTKPANKNAAAAPVAAAAAAAPLAALPTALPVIAEESAANSAASSGTSLSSNSGRSGASNNGNTY